MAGQAEAAELVDDAAPTVVAWWPGARAWLGGDPVTVVALEEDGIRVRHHLLGHFREVVVAAAALGSPPARPGPLITMPVSAPAPPRPDVGELRAELATAIAAVADARAGLVEADRVLAKGQQHLADMERAQHQVAALDRLSEDVLISVMRHGCAEAPRELLEQELSAGDVATAVATATRICGRLGGEQEIARSEVARAERVVRQVAAKVVAAEAEDVGDRLLELDAQMRELQLEGLAISRLWLSNAGAGEPVAPLPISPRLVGVFERLLDEDGFPPAIAERASRERAVRWRQLFDRLLEDPAAALGDEEAPAIAAE